ncbi:cadmium transporter [Spirochaetia bacterium]|nr:cadmium transporter [Spirochaetia bacterium]
MVNIKQTKGSNYKGSNYRGFNYRVFIFPAVLAVLIVLSALTEYLWTDILPFPLALAPLAAGAFVVCKSTFEAVITKKKITAGMLVVLALIGTTVVGEYLSGAIVAFMMIFGEFLEDLTMEKTKNALRELIRLVPPTCRKLVDGEYTVVPIKKIRKGDWIQILAGEKIAVDGVIVKGQAAINQASITGESMPVDKKPGDQVFVGTLNENGVIEVETEKLGSETTLGKIIQTVKQAQENKGEAQKTADTFAQYFFPIIVLICIVTFFITKDIMRVMTILVIACPCALVLATPTAVVACVGNRAKRGVLIKGGIAIERCAKVSTLCFDKTGTITKGMPEVLDTCIAANTSEKDFFYVLGITEKNSGHPIGKAVIAYLSEKKSVIIKDIPDGDFEMLYGRGVRVRMENDVYEVSNKKLLSDFPADDPEITSFVARQESLGRTVMLAAENARILGALSVADTIRESVPKAIRQLKESGITHIVMLTGDNEFTAKAICDEAGIDEFRANLLPEQKLEAIKEMQARGEVVAMIGDGVNDAPALVLADVGIAMGAAGTDVAVEAASIALMSDNIAVLSATFALCRRTFSIIKQNIWIFAVIVNVCGVLLSGLGFLNPIMAAVIHNASSIFVVLNSSRLLAFRYAGES